jgi:hypothetical protein
VAVQTTVEPMVTKTPIFNVEFVPIRLTIETAAFLLWPNGLEKRGAIYFANSQILHANEIVQESSRAADTSILH